MDTVAEVFKVALDYHQSGRWQQAESLYRQILQVDPNHAGACFFLGTLAHQMGHRDTALELIGRAITLHPFDPAFHYNLGNVLAEQGRLNEAVHSYRHALQLNPQYARAYNNLGMLLLTRGEVAEATDCFLQAARCHPEDPGICLHLGHLLAAQGKGEEAALQYHRCLQLPVDQANSKWQRSLLRLLQGDFERGWPEYEESRWGVPGVSQRHFDRPRWDGSSFAGKTLLLHAEQGLGDTIQFLRYAPLVKKRGGRVLFESPPSLLRLLEGVAGIDEIVPRGQPIPAFDIQAPLLSLPVIFGTTLGNLPRDIPYLATNADLVARWRIELEPLQGLKVGIAWQGDPGNLNDRLRSLPLAHFEALARIKGVRLVSLQKDFAAEQVRSMAEKFPVLDLHERLDTAGAFIDTAAIMRNLDLVVTIDTAVAHLAGALGIRVWTLLSYLPDWRWLLDRSDSPWYPTMRLFRQDRPCDWSGVLERVAAEACRLLAP
jgi:Tfp pilus assembly protein PilF